MQINLVRKNDAFLMEATNESGNKITIDASPDIGGVGGGPRPMELVAMALGGCSSIDIINILKKQKQEIETFSVQLDAKRRDGETPSLFKTIHVDFILTGSLDFDKVKRAAALSMDKYCSVSKTVEKTAEITYAVTVNGQKSETIVAEKL